MSTETLFLLMLAPVYALAGMHHLLIWHRSTGARDHFWVGMVALAAAGAAANHPASTGGASTLWMPWAVRLASFLAIAWLIAVIWFITEHGAGDGKRRRVAYAATLVLAMAGIGDLLLSATEWPALRAFAQDLPWLLVTAVLATAFCLAIDGALRLWRSARRGRAAVLVTLGIVTGVAALQAVWPGGGFAQLPPPVLYAFLLVVIAMSSDLASTIADSDAVSERQRQELAHASRLSVVGELTASIAHEINQPLGAILSNADAGEILLERPDPPLDEIQKILGDIRRDGLRASDVIRHVRTLVRKRELELERLDANAVAAEVIALLEPEARRRRIGVASALSPQAAYLYGDRALMEQVHINLILNAMDAVEAAGAGEGTVPARPPIVLGVSTTPHGEIEFRITDTGKGIPTEQLRHLFDSFYTSKPHGMGLGLSIARSIVEVHGGRIQAENNRDVGATFRVTLPPYRWPHA